MPRNPLIFQESPWYVPQDVAGLITAMGGDDVFVKKLDSVFEAKVDPSHFANVEDITGLIGWYAHGNEPSHHLAYLYDYAGAPWQTQKRLKQIMDSQYAPRPDGLAGNDDLGQMSAWYIFTALGFYPVAPGSDEYAIGRPFLSRAALHLADGKTFTITAAPSTTPTPTSAPSPSMANRWTASTSTTMRFSPVASSTSRCKPNLTVVGDRAPPHGLRR